MATPSAAPSLKGPRWHPRATASAEHSRPDARSNRQASAAGASVARPGAPPDFSGGAARLCRVAKIVALVVGRAGPRSSLDRQESPHMPDRPLLPGKFVWFELVSADARRAQAFYAEALGWKVVPFPMGHATYELIYAGDTMIGGYAPPARAAGP